MALLGALFGGITQQPDDNGVHQPFGLTDSLIAGDVVEFTGDGTITGRPPGFPWGGHSNGVSQRP